MSPAAGDNCRLCFIYIAPQYAELYMHCDALVSRVELHTHAVCRS